MNDELFVRVVNLNRRLTKYPFKYLQRHAFYFGLGKAQLIDVHLLHQLRHVNVTVLEDQENGILFLIHHDVA